MLPSCRLIHAANDSLGVRSFRTTQLFDRPCHTRHGMFREQLQHTDILADSTTRTVPIFQPCSQFAECWREFPIAVDVRVIQRRRSSRKRYQIMQRIKNLVARLIAAFMRGHDLIVMDDVHSVNVAFDGHGLEGRLARNAVADFVKTGELILIDFRRFADAGIETMPRQFGCVLSIATELLINGLLRIA